MLAGIAKAASPSFSSFNTNQFSTNNLFISIKDGATITNTVLRGQPSIPGTSFVFNGTTITNINQGSGGGGDSLWTNISNVLQPVAGATVLTTNLQSQTTLNALGAFVMPTTATYNLVMGANCIEPHNTGTMGVIGATGLFSDSTLTLGQSTNLVGQILIILNNDPTNFSGFQMIDGDDYCAGPPTGWTRLNGNWETEQYGDGLILFNTGEIWTEIGRFFGTTNNVVIDGVWQYVDGVIKPVSENVDRINIYEQGAVSIGLGALNWVGPDLNVGMHIIAAPELGEQFSEVEFLTYNNDTGLNWGWDFIARTNAGLVRMDAYVEGDEILSFRPNVASSGTAVAYKFGTSNYLNTSGDMMAAFPNAGTNVNTINHNGGITIGRDAAGQWGNNQSLTAFYNTALGEPNTSEGTFGVTDGGALFKYIDLVVSESLGGQFVMDNGALEVHLNPGVTSTGSAVAHKLGTSQVLTNGDTFVSINNTDAPILRFSPAESGNPSGQIVFGRGGSNILAHVESDLTYTNGTLAGYGFRIKDPASSSKYAKFYVDNGGGARIIGDTSQSVALAPDLGNTVYLASAQAFQPTSSGKDIGAASANGNWRDFYINNNIVWNGTPANLIDTWGTATPEGAETAGPGSLFRLTNAVGKVYLKVTGTGNTGWAELATTSSAQTIYDQLVHPHRADQVGAVLNTSDPSSVNYGHALFSGTAATNANFIEYRWQVPKNINTSVDLQASWSVMLNAADTDASTYTIGMASVAASSSYAAPTLGNYVTLTVAADASGAQNDYETVQDVTLTGWAAALTAGNVFVIRVARDGAGDTSNVAHYDAGLTIKYSTQ